MGLEWVVWGGWATPSRTYPGASAHPASGPPRQAGARSLRSLSGGWAPRAIRARFTVISCKVSQNDEVSPNLVEKASHSPCFQNGLQKSPLDFPRFPYSTAFSHKELMGCFRPNGGVYCQNDEVSPDVHTGVRVRGMNMTHFTEFRTCFTEFSTCFTDLHGRLTEKPHEIRVNTGKYG